MAFLAGLGVAVTRVGLEAGALSAAGRRRGRGHETVLLETRHVKSRCRRWRRTDRRDAADRELSSCRSRGGAGFEPVEAGSNARYLEPVSEMNIHFGFFLGWGTSAAPAWIKAA